MPVDLLQHNKKTYEKIKNIFQTESKTCVVQPTGTGKSYLIMKLIEDYAENNREIIVIEPQKYIINQLEKEMEECGLSNKNVKFVTYASLSGLDVDKIQEFDNPCMVIVDEMHRAGAVTWIKGLQLMFNELPKDCKYIGLSATPIRYLDNKRDMCLELFNGNIANEVSLTDAIIDRILPLPRYIAGLYTYDNIANPLAVKIEKSTNSQEEKEKLLNELKTLKRNLDKSKGVSSIFKKYIIGDKGKYIAFCRDIDHLQEMKPSMKKWLKEAGIKANIYEVHYKNPNKNEDFQAFKNDEGLAVCMSIGMLSEGIHGVNGVILLRDTISPNLYYQQIGRAFAVKMNSVPIIFDLVVNCNSIIDCQLKDDLLDAIDRREKEKNKNKDQNGGTHFDDISDYGKEITREDVENFFVFDQVLDAISSFRNIENRLQGNFELYLKALRQYKEREGDCLVPLRHIEVMSDRSRIKLGQWVIDIRRTKKGNVNYILTENMIEKLDELGFVWDAIEYNFTNNVNDCVKFYEENKRLPSEHSKDMKEKRLGQFLSSEKKKIKTQENYPQWKINLLKQIPTFFDKRKNKFDRFCRNVLLYKEMHGHTDIKIKDKIANYRIGNILNSIRQDYKNNKLSSEQVEKLKNLGVDLTDNKYEKQFKETFKLAKQALNEGVVISRQDQRYKEINLYNWFRYYRDKFTLEELKIMNKLVPNNNEKPVKVLDIKENRIYNYPSIAEAGRALCNQFYVVGTEKSGRTVIINRLKGKTKNPLYKERFRFEYADPSDIHSA